MSHKTTMDEDDDDDENYDFRALYFAFFSIYLGRTLILPLLPSYANAIWYETTGENKLSDDKQGLLAALFYLSYAISGIMFGPLSMRIGRKSTLLICIIGITFGFIGQGLSNSYWCLVFNRGFAGFFAAINGLCQSYISDICKPHHVPKYTARLGTVFGLVFGFGPLFGGLLSEFNNIILKNIYFNSNFPQSLKYQYSLFFGATITGFATFIVIFKLKESLPQSLRISWTKNTKNNNKKNMIQSQINNNINNLNKQKEGSIQNETRINTNNICETLSIIPHPDYDDVSKLILNIFDLKEENKIIKQIRFNMKQCEDSELITDQIMKECHLDQIYKKHIINSINDYIPENITNNNNNNNNNIDFERDIDFIDYNDYNNNNNKNNKQHQKQKLDNEYIDFVELFEALLPENEKTAEFKYRLKIYMIIILLITIIMDIATAGHATIFALLNNGRNCNEGLNWNNDLIFSITWMFYGIAYSGIQYFYVRLQKRYGVFITGAIGCFIKLIGCILIPLLTIICRNIKLNNQWIELIIHFPASILNGIGYGLCNTTTQTVISDFSKRYNVRSVGNWLGCWMASVALGASGVILLGSISQKYGCINTFYFCALLAFIACLTFIYLSIIAKDIKIIVDIKEVVAENQDLGDKLEQLINDDIEKSVSSILGSTLSPAMSNIIIKRTSTAGSLARNVTESITKLSLTQSLSSFNVSTPFGPLPIAPPSQLIGVPMINSKIFDGQKHINLKENFNILTLTPRSSMKSLDLNT